MYVAVFVEKPTQLGPVRKDTCAGTKDLVLLPLPFVHADLRTPVHFTLASL